MLNYLIVLAIILLDGLLLFFSLKYPLYSFLLSLLMISISMFPIFFHFERRKAKAEEVILIAALSAIAAIGRIPFAALPSIQPTSFIIILTGIVFGGETGFLVGSIGALTSNLLLGQGPWTPWQMFAWGMMGLSSGYFQKYNLTKPTITLLIFGFIWGFLFGWIMNIWSILSFFGEVSWPIIATSYLGSFPFDLAHAVGNVLFLKLFTLRWLKIFTRIKVKYGLLS